MRAIFFDAVGTIIHPEPAAHLVYANVGRLFGSRHASQDIAQRFAQAFHQQEAIDRRHDWATSEERERERWQNIVSAVLDDIADPARCFACLYDHFRQPTSWRCEPGIAELFSALDAQGYLLGLASNFDERLFGLVESLTPLHHFVGHSRVTAPVIVSSQVGSRKPAKEFFASMCSQAGFAAADILHVGDDPLNDYAGARAAGLQAVLFDPRGKHSNLAGRRIQDLHELRNLLESHSGKP